MNDWQQRYSDYLKNLSTPSSLAFIKELREALLDNPHLWYQIIFDCQRKSQQKPLLAALLVLRLGLAKRLHQDVQVLLMHASIAVASSRQASCGNDFADHLLHALKSPTQAHEYPLMIHHSVHCAATLCDVPTQSEADAWRSWLQRNDNRPAWLWLQQLADCYHAALSESDGDYFIPARDTAWLGAPQQATASSKDIERQQRQSAFITPLLDAYKRNLKLQAPTQLLAALRNYGNGEGQIQPLVRAIQPHRSLTSAIVDAAAAQNHQLARHQSDQRLGRAMIWLGPNRVAHIIAKALLKSQLTNYQFAAQPLILAHISLLQSVLPRLIRHSQVSLTLKLPNQLLALLWSAGLLASKSLRLSARIDNHRSIDSWHCCNWFACREPEGWFQEFSLQVAKRWQLDTGDISAVNNEHANQAISALMVCASAAVIRVYQPHRKLTEQAKKQLGNSLKTLNINTKTWNTLLTNAAQNEAAQVPWPPL